MKRSSGNRRAETGMHSMWFDVKSVMPLDRFYSYWNYGILVNLAWIIIYFFTDVFGDSANHSIGLTFIYVHVVLSVMTVLTYMASINVEGDSRKAANLKMVNYNSNYLLMFGTYLALFFDSSLYFVADSVYCGGSSE